MNSKAQKMAYDNMEFMINSHHNHHLLDPKKQSNQSELSYPNADVAITVSPTTLLNPNRYVCEVCYKGFPRKQNLTLHRRVHNLPFALKTTTTSKDPKPRKVYLCPEPTCVHHNQSHALGDFGGLRKHYLRKHCSHKNYKCDTCCKAYTVETDLKAHLKICGRKKYICHCGGCPFSSGADKYLHTRDIGDRSVKSTRNDTSSSRIGMGDNSSRYPQGGSNFCKTPTSSSSTTQNQHECLEKYSDMDFYADLLMDKIPLHKLNLEEMSIIGDGGISYATGDHEGLNSFSNGGYNMFDPSSSLNFTPGTCNINDGGSCYGYGGGMEEVAPSEPQLNQNGFWF